MKHLILLVAMLSLATAFVSQDDQPATREAKNETAAVSMVETAG